MNRLNFNGMALSNSKGHIVLEKAQSILLSPTLMSRLPVGCSSHEMNRLKKVHRLCVVIVVRFCDSFCSDPAF